MLLEEYNVAEVSFSTLQENIESLIEFAASPVTVEVDMTILEAENDAAVSKAKDNFFKKIVDQVKAFLVKFAENVKHFVAKVKVAIADKGNKAMKKLLADSKKVLKRNITVKEIEYKGQKGPGLLSSVFDDIVEDSKAQVAAIKKAVDSNDLSDFEEADKMTDKDIDEAIKTMNEDLLSSDIVKGIEVKAGTTVKAAYDVHVEQYVGWASKKVADIQACYNASKSMLADLEKGLKKTQSFEKGLKKEEGSNATWGDGESINKMLSGVRKCSMSTMRSDTAVLNCAFKVLSLGVSNSAKIALAAGAEKKEKEEA